MAISNGEAIKNLILYPPREPSSSNKHRFTLTQKSLLVKEPESEDEEIRPILTIIKALYFKYEMEDDSISTFLRNLNFIYDSTH